MIDLVPLFFIYPDEISLRFHLLFHFLKCCNQYISIIDVSVRFQTVHFNKKSLNNYIIQFLFSANLSARCFSSLLDISYSLIPKLSPERWWHGLRGFPRIIIIRVNQRQPLRQLTSPTRMALAICGDPYSICC